MQLAYNVPAPDTVAAWRTSFLHLGENENWKKETNNEPKTSDCV